MSISDHEEKQNLSHYREYVQRVAEEADGERIILNRTAGHAAIIVAALFAKAERKLEILTTCLADDVFGQDEVLRSVGEFLQKPDTEIDVLHEANIEPHSNKFLHAIHSAGFGNRIGTTLVPASVQADYDFHFAVADACHYRFQETRGRREAIVQFGNARTGHQIREVFQNLKNRALGYNVPSNHAK